MRKPGTWLQKSKPILLLWNIGGTGNESLWNNNGCFLSVYMPEWNEQKWPKNLIWENAKKELINMNIYIYIFRELILTDTNSYGLTHPRLHLVFQALFRLLFWLIQGCRVFILLGVAIWYNDIDLCIPSFLIEVEKNKGEKITESPLQHHPAVQALLSSYLLLLLSAVLLVNEIKNAKLESL